jgi:starch-binding outer membrane protein, SusD/RagB family
MNSLYKYFTTVAFTSSLLILIFGSCKKFVMLDDPRGQLTTGAVFSENGSATAAVLSLYTDYLDYTLPVMCKTAGLAADELVTSDPLFVPYLSNDILPSTASAFPGETWVQEYAHIRKCNLAIAGLTNSTTINKGVKDQLLGEARFLRAFGFFNLLNLFGAVPLTLSVNENENALLPRAPVEDVWLQIFSDLTMAKELVSADYPTAERVRVNKSAVSALLARAYLYHNEWEKAEAEASKIIDLNIYSLANPADVFTPGSNETILQVYIQQGLYPIVFDYLPAAPGFAPSVYLRDGFDAGFEPGDLRRESWVGAESGVSYIKKYKNNDFASTEYCVLFRLAEIYLIRAEARANQNNLTGANSAAADINAVRYRSNLTSKSIANKTSALMAIEQERKVELFGEYPHRWFDLKRMKGFTDPTKTRADEILSVVKGLTWQPTDKLFPIKSDDISLNHNLIQNEGYPE